MLDCFDMRDWASSSIVEAAGGTAGGICGEGAAGAAGGGIDGAGMAGGAGAAGRGGGDIIWGCGGICVCC